MYLLATIWVSQKTFNKSCLVEITESIRQALDNKKIACGIFVDLQIAFDTVNHEIRIAKLDYYGIRGIANNWFSSYLKNRSQYVSILGFESNTKPAIHGVPQGSVLGPLLFLIYINDLHTVIKSKVYHFADDTNLLKINCSPRKLQKHLNDDLKILYNWLLANKISLNCDKTEIIFFHKQGEKIPNIKIKMNSHRIYPSKSIKYLGIYIDETLNGSYHCKNIQTILKRANGMLCKARHYVDAKNLKSLCYAIFSSHLVYGCQIWGQTINIHNKRIFKLQNRAMRKLSDQIGLQNCLFVHDSLKGMLPICFNEYFNLLKNVHHIHTKSSQVGCLFVPSYSSTRYGLNSLTKKCISDWNNFSKKFNLNLLSLSRDKLKSNIKSHFVQLYI